MQNFINRTYGAGVRAGSAEPVIATLNDGTKRLLHPQCPFTGRLQFIQRWLWEDGVMMGSRKRLTRWIAARDAYNAGSDC